MKKLKLGILFSLVVLITYISGFVLTTVIVFLGVRMNLLTISSTPPEHTFIPWIPLIGTSVTVGILILSFNLILSRQLFQPIHRLIRALSQVASGDFKAELPENSSWSEIREMNRNFNHMTKELQSTELLQSDFIQNVSHEFKTPLAAMDGFLSLLAETPLSEEQSTYVERIRTSCSRLTSLTGNVLLLSKLENHPPRLERSAFALDEQLRRCILSMEPLWSGKDLSLDVELPDVTYVGNEDLLEHVWNNLLSNAIRYTPQGGILTVHLTEDAKTVQVRCSDTGIGMTKEVQERIFDKFYQEDRSHSGTGNGLGLALVKRIVTLCGGSISVESTPEVGSTFLVQLPKETS